MGSPLNKNRMLSRFAATSWVCVLAVAPLDVAWSGSVTQCVDRRSMVYCEEGQEALCSFDEGSFTGRCVARFESAKAAWEVITGNDSDFEAKILLSGSYVNGSQTVTFGPLKDAQVLQEDPVPKPPLVGPDVNEQNEEHPEEVKGP